MDGDSATAGRYRARARQLRTIAETLGDATSRAILLGVADEYERMAKTMDGVAQSDIARADKKA